ncbi:unnamed protein product [Pylaiella littoralis]
MGLIVGYVGASHISEVTCWLFALVLDVGYAIRTCFQAFSVVALAVVKCFGGCWCGGGFSFLRLTGTRFCTTFSTYGSDAFVRTGPVFLQIPLIHPYVRRINPRARACYACPSFGTVVARARMGN